MPSTRSSLILPTKKEETSQDKKKNVSFFDSSTTENESLKSCEKSHERRRIRKRRKTRLSSSLISEEPKAEGSDLSTMSLSTIPRKILRPFHPLQYAWTFWFFKNTRNLSWEQNQTKMVTVDNVEDFWQIINYIKPPSELGRGSDYSVFRAGIFPDWEDFQNMSGGRWIIRNKDQTNLDSNWLELLFLLIGEHAGEKSGQINGVVVNVRSGRNKLAVWLKDARDMSSVVTVGRMVKSRLGLGPDSRIQFSVHREEREKVGGTEISM